MDKHLKYTPEISATTVLLPQSVSTRIKLSIPIVYWIPLRTVQLPCVFMLLEMATTTKILIPPHSILLSRPPMHLPAPLLQCQLLRQPSNITVPQASPKAILGSQQISTGLGMTAVLLLFTHSLWCHRTKAPASALGQPPTSPPWATATHHGKGGITSLVLPTPIRAGQLSARLDGSWWPPKDWFRRKEEKRAKNAGKMVILNKLYSWLVLGILNPVNCIGHLRTYTTRK